MMMMMMVILVIIIIMIIVIKITMVLPFNIELFLCMFEGKYQFNSMDNAFLIFSCLPDIQVAWRLQMPCQCVKPNQWFAEY